MIVQALKLVLHQGGLKVQSAEIDTDRRINSILEQGTQPTVYLVQSGDLDRLRACHGVIDRGVKDPRVGLTRLLAACAAERIPLIDGGYRSPGQVERSLREFLANLRGKGESRAYLVGVQPEMFDAFSARVPAALTRHAGQGNHAQAGAAAQRSVSHAGHGGKMSQIIELLRQRLSGPDDERYLGELRGEFFGDAPEYELIRISILLAAKSRDPVLILGETGTGKDKVARLIHRYGVVYGVIQDDLMNALNCAAIPSDLLEAELFGSVKGVATGVTDRPGLWEASQRGTFFLDEIGELRLDHQAKILRALDKKAIRRVGDLKDRPVQARIVAATNRDLTDSRLFRPDLYFRLSGSKIRTVPLRRHPEVIPQFAQRLWQRILQRATETPASSAQARPAAIPPEPLQQLPDDVTAALQRKPWPGNVRDLGWILKRLFSTFGDSDLNATQLEAIFYLDQQDWSLDPADIGAAALNRHQLDCVNHLARTAEILHDARIALARVFPEDAGNPREFQRWHQEVDLVRRELEDQCSRPSLFFEENLFDEVWRLIGRLTLLSERLDQGHPGPTAVQQDLEQALRQVQANLTGRMRELEQSI